LNTTAQLDATRSDTTLRIFVVAGEYIFEREFFGFCFGKEKKESEKNFILCSRLLLLVIRLRHHPRGQSFIYIAMFCSLCWCLFVFFLHSE